MKFRNNENCRVLIVDPDNPDRPLSSTAREVPENTPAGSAIGDPVTATDAGNDEGASPWSESGTGRTGGNTSPLAVDDAITVTRGSTISSLANFGNSEARTTLGLHPGVPPEHYRMVSEVSAPDTAGNSVLDNDRDGEDSVAQLTAEPAAGLSTGKTGEPDYRFGIGLVLNF